MYIFTCSGLLQLDVLIKAQRLEMLKLKNHHPNTDPCFNAFYGERKMKTQW